MAKSKYRSKVHEKIDRGDSQLKVRHVYYDEKKTKQGITISKNITVLLIGTMIIGAGTGVYFLMIRSDIEFGRSPFVDVGIQEGDSFRAHYKLWVADKSGPSGTLDIYDAPYQDSTSGDPFESTTSGVIEGFKNNIIGMKEGEEKTFTLEAGEGYTDGDLANYKLTFWVQIVEIL